MVFSPKSQGLKAAPLTRRGQGGPMPLMVILISLAPWLAAVDGPAPGSVTETGSIAGTVIDTAGYPLPYANIMLPGTELGAVSDAAGRYRVAEVPPGRYIVRVLYLGCTKADFPLEVEAGVAVHLDVTLERRRPEPETEVETVFTHCHIQGIVSDAICVQEFWEDGSPFYAIANLTDAAVDVGVRNTRCAGERDVAGPVLASWTVPEHRTRFVSAAGLDTLDTVQFELDGESCGRMPPMRRPPCADGVVTAGSMNVGGRGDEAWIEQPTVTLKSGESLEVTLHFPEAMFPEGGVIVFGDRPAIMDYLSPGRQAGEYRLPTLLPRSVDSSSLSVETQAGVTVVHVPPDDGKGAAHEARLRFQAPEFSDSGPAVILACVYAPGWSWWLTRMFLIEG